MFVWTKMRNLTIATWDLCGQIQYVAVMTFGDVCRFMPHKSIHTLRTPSVKTNPW